MSGLMTFYIVLGLLLTLLAIPLWYEKINPNGLYGFRVQKTMENRKIWYAVNKYFAPWLAATGLLTAFSAIVLYQVPGISLNAFSLNVLAIFVFVFFLGITNTVRYMNSL
jgi:uncharacterized membrane protein